MQFVIGFLIAMTISATARRVRSLSYSGALAATGLGTIVYGFGGWQAAVILITFFVSSSLLGSHARARRGQPEGKYAKGHDRDAGQVLGNGLTAGVLAVAMSTDSAGLWPWLGYSGAIAAVTADTWATELGALLSSTPRLITTLRQRVPAGTSGGVSAVGTIAAALGATLIGVLGAILAPTANAVMIAPIAIAGLLGAIFDSLLGATVQAMYRCVQEGIETEQHPLHSCGAATLLIRGWPWLNNDWVNLACATLGAVLAIGIGAVLGLA